MHDAVLVLAWLALAHLVADFVLQSAAIASAKSAHGRRAVAGLLSHGLIVALLVVPVGLAFGDRGWVFVVVTALSHVLIDRTKVVLTRRAAAAALREAHERHEMPQPADHLGRAWTSVPAALFLVDQAAHLAIAGIGWALLLAANGPTTGWMRGVDEALGSWDRATVHGVVSVAVTLGILGIVNIRAASLFVGVLVRPVEVTAGGEHRWGSRVAPAVGEPTAATSTGSATLATASGSASAPVPASANRRRWSIRLGPLDAHVTAEDEAAAPVAGGAAAAGAAASAPGHSTTSAPLGASARVGSTIGILERVLIVVFVLTGTDVAIGFVVAAKTLARFRLLDDRDFAEYYLLGTLASVAVAIVSALIGRTALGALLG
jgi:Protein of unknown function (DUF3307)